MDIEPVDPRDTEWETDQPVYRVCFWSRSTAPAGVPSHQVGSASREYRVTDAADVHEVLRWAESEATDAETFTLHVETTVAGARGLILLAGQDPTAAAAPRLTLLISPAETPAALLFNPEELDLDGLADALQDQGAFDLHQWLFDRITGEVVFWNLDVGAGDEQGDLDEMDHLIPVDPLPSGVWYGDMVDFVEGLGDERAGARLARALRGKGAFRRFRSALHETDPELVPVWHAFRNARARRRAVQWLRDHDLVSDDAAEAYAERHPDPRLP